MSERKDGGPAFPVAPDDLVGSKGMSLRDWFAGQAIPTALDLSVKYSKDVNPAAWAATSAYELADAMLAARNAAASK